MPHLIIEHSSDINKNSIKTLAYAVHNILDSITEGNFKSDECKVRFHSFDEYFVGKPDQSTSSFLHITIKILAGRTLEARKKLAEQTLQAARKLYSELATTPSPKDQLVAIGSEVIEALAGIPQPHLSRKTVILPISAVIFRLILLRWIKRRIKKLESEINCSKASKYSVIFSIKGAYTLSR